MSQFVRTGNFPITVNGQTVIVTTTYKATYSDDPSNHFISRMEFTITPCDVVGSPELEGIKSQITDWTKQAYLDSQNAAGITGTASTTTTNDPDSLANFLWDEAKQCAPAVGENDTAESVTASVEQNGQGFATVAFGDGSETTMGFDQDGNQTWAYQKNADGSGQLSDANGTKVSFDPGELGGFSVGADGSPDLQISHDGHEVNISRNDDGTLSVNVDGGASVTVSADDTLTTGSAGVSVDQNGGPGPGGPGPGPGGPGPGPGGPGPGPGGPGPGGPGPGGPGPGPGGGSFSKHHPNPLQ